MSKNWTYNEGKALISVYAGRKEDYFKTGNKKHFWSNLLTELESQDFLVSPTTVENVEVKWRSLYRAYKNAKDRGTGSTPTKFLYMDEMENIFRNNPIVGSQTDVSVGVENRPEPAPMRIPENYDSYDTDGADTEGAGISATQEKTNQQKKKEQLKVNLKGKSLELKRQYYENLIDEKKKKRELMEKYLSKKEQDRDERNQILKLLAKKD